MSTKTQENVDFLRGLFTHLMDGGNIDSIDLFATVYRAMYNLILHKQCHLLTDLLTQTFKLTPVSPPSNDVESLVKGLINYTTAATIIQDVTFMWEHNREDSIQSVVDMSKQGILTWLEPHRLDVFNAILLQSKLSSVEENSFNVSAALDALAFLDILPMDLPPLDSPSRLDSLDDLVDAFRYL